MHVYASRLEAFCAYNSKLLFCHMPQVHLAEVWNTSFAPNFVLQVWNDEDPDDEVLAMVVRTGCNSTIGNMLRRAVRPSHFLSATDSLVKASCVLLICTPQAYMPLTVALQLERFLSGIGPALKGCCHDLLGG